MTKITFNQVGTFSALYTAQAWLRDNGYSYGSSCVGMPIGILKGVWSIVKWRNLTGKEREQLDGQLISEDFREGPIILHLKDLATDDEIKAGTRIRQGAVS